MIGKLLEAGAVQVLQHAAQILEVEQRQPAVVAILKDYRQHALLYVGQLQHLADRSRRGTAWGWYFKVQFSALKAAG